MILSSQAGLLKVFFTELKWANDLSSTWRKKTEGSSWRFLQEMLETALEHFYKSGKPKAEWRKLLTIISQCFCVSIASNTLSVWTNTKVCT